MVIRSHQSPGQFLLGIVVTAHVVRYGGNLVNFKVMFAVLQTFS